MVPSVLDRLRDDEPEVSFEPVRARSKTVAEIKQSVRKDLQRLFNTRQGFPGEPRPGQPELVGELQNSLLTYGLPDFCSTSVTSPLDQNRIRRALKLAIERFEPRLCDVDVKLLPTAASERALHFLIVANLRVKPAPEAVTFDTVLLIASGEYRIEAR
jgi:type VI secretion system protein ImpF